MMYSKILHAYSQFAAKTASAPLETPTDDAALLIRLKAVQQEWQKGEGINFAVKSWQQLHKQPIDASSGGSGFLTHETIEKRLREDIAAHEMADYVNHIPDKNLVRVATRHFKDQKIIPVSATLGEDPYDDSANNTFYAMHGHGTTELFNFALKAIIKTPGDVIVTTSPTYGLFVDPISEHKGNIVSLPLVERSSYKPSAVELAKLISETNLELQKKYTHTLNITATILQSLFSSAKICKPESLRLANELNDIRHYFAHKMPFVSFTKIDDLVNDFNRSLHEYLKSNVSTSGISTWEEKLRLPLCQRVRGYFHINPHMPIGNVLTQKEIDILAGTLEKFPDITVIDDITYYELVLPPSKKQPGTFANTKTMQQRSLTLYGVSKQFGLAAIRSGFALGSKNIIRSIAHDIFMHANMPSVYSQNALRYVFSLPLDEKTKYLEETRAEYAFRRDLTFALVEGISCVKNKSHQTKIYEMLNKNKISTLQQQEILKGIPELSIAHTPEAGFFVLLDFSAFKGKYIGTVQLKTSMDMQKFIYCLTDVNTVPSELNFDFSKPSLRFSFCMPPTDIIEALLRIRKVLAQCSNAPLPEPLPKEKAPKLTVKKPVTYSFNGRMHMTLTEPKHNHGTRLKMRFKG